MQAEAAPAAVVWVGSPALIHTDKQSSTRAESTIKTEAAMALGTADPRNSLYRFHVVKMLN